MKRKQLHLSEEDLNIIIDALHNQWWIRYDPNVEVTVVPHHKLFERLITAASSFSKND
jgi:hypothetical protein